MQPCTLKVEVYTPMAWQWTFIHGGSHMTVEAVTNLQKTVLEHGRLLQTKPWPEANCCSVAPSINIPPKGWAN